MLRYYVLATISIGLFLKGFFPISNKSNLKIADDESTQYTFDSAMVNSTTPPVEKMVLIIIDALRTDFITPKLMPNVSAILRNNRSCYNHIKVEMPTVTLPRIKAITTGSIPQFIDIVLNLAHIEALEDSLIHQAYRKQKRIVFYGDDTWLKLFAKKYFVRSDGVSSFYVNDYTEVDDNVTRNIDRELNNDDWDIMILHYLGLDHIGHVYGPKSNLIPQKLKEMDDIFYKIHKRLVENREKSLILLTGDHGMKDSGGHGGSTYHETNIPLILAGIQCSNSTFEQIDIPVNVGVLLGLDIPKTSIGQVRKSVLGDIEIEEYLEVLRYNTRKLRQNLDLCYEDYVTATYLHDRFRTNNRLEIGEQARHLYENCSKLISENLMKSSVNQNLNSLIISLLTILYILLQFTMKSYNKIQQSVLKETLIFIIVLVQYFDFYDSLTVFSTLIISVIIIVTLVDLIAIFSSISLLKLGLITSIFILHPFIFLSSSFIEEEHQFWYFFLGNLIIFQIFHDYNNNKLVLSNCLIIIGVRFLRTINQTGDQWASYPDLSDWLLEPGNYHYLQIFFITSLLLVYKSCLFILNKQYDYISGLILVLIYIFRTLIANVNLGRILWFLLFVNGIINRNPVQFWVLIVSLLLKPYNIILIPFAIFTSAFLKDKFRDLNSILTHLCLSNYLFFCQGNGNSLANVDISTGYIGLSYYQPIFVFLQVFSHTYSLPILVNLLLLQFQQIGDLFFVLFYQRVFIVFLVLIVAFIQRQHLFIWSVFAPKIIIETSHFVAILLQMCCISIVHSIKTLNR